jgi:adenosine deaminase CECR1
LQTPSSPGLTIHEYRFQTRSWPALVYQLPSKSHHVSEEAYSKTQNALAKAEHDLGFTTTAQPTALEREASLIVEKMRNCGILHTNHDDGRYLHGIKTIQKGVVLEIAKEAPKGALLHCHLEAMLRPEENLLIDAREQKNLYIHTDAPLTSQGFFDAALPRFQLVAEDSELM